MCNLKFDYKKHKGSWFKECHVDDGLVICGSILPPVGMFRETFDQHLAFSK